MIDPSVFVFREEYGEKPNRKSNHLENVLDYNHVSDYLALYR